MKKKIMLYIMVLCMAFLMTGCGEKIKAENEMKKDLMNSSFFNMVEGSEISELTVIKRLTDEKNKTDKVYVAVTVDHPAATATRAYIMNYTCYNDGWLLDSAEEYYGDEVEWTTVPKNVPTNEEIMEQVIERSNAQIEAAYEEQYARTDFKDTYFFEEGKYAMNIYTGNMISDLEYECFVETERVFEYATVFQSQILYFVFDTYTYEWQLSFDEIYDLTCDWHIEGEWRVPVNGATIQLEYNGCEYDYESELNNRYIYYGNCTYYDKCITFELVLKSPSSQKISSGTSVFGSYGSNTISLTVEIGPDTTWCYDWGTDSNFKLEPVNIEENTVQLGTIGIVDKTMNPNLEEYKKVAEDVFKWILIEHDLEKVEAIMHPALKENEKLDWKHIKQYFQEDVFENGSYSVTNMVHYETRSVFEELSEEEQEELKQELGNVNIESVVGVIYYINGYQDGDRVDAEYIAIFAKIDGEIYFLTLN